MPDVKHFDPETVLDIVVRLFWRRGAAATGISDVVAATGLNRSSLYATFGGKKELYAAALSRYVERQSGPVFDRLAGDERGIPAISEFFRQLIQARCHGEYARWGCMVSNAHAGSENTDPDIGRILDHHHHRLRAAMRSALETAHTHGRLQPGVDIDTAAESLALLAYGVNLRSRAGAEPEALEAAVRASLGHLGVPNLPPEEMS